ncbi:reticulophagy regulator 3-like isoform X2 [Acanthaster planci]|uniref:Reticulophagy regulator 3-like isoform X2 n=1 Tax=Acanthaster planci TaxID=133434 RepID=A0A8B7XIG3_ACAPL|nr:reticulophagy regulator 3-like isoform X2 [Acanthaster planci]
MTQTKTSKNVNMDENGEGSVENPVNRNFSDSEMREFERQAKVKLHEKRLRELLGPLEGFIMSVQSLLVWEKPARSAVMLLCVNGLFWLTVTSHYRVVFLGAVSCILFVSMETIRTKVWPEIRVHQPDEDDEGWTPVHPHLLSLPELCDHVAKLWVTMESLNTRIWQLRKEHPSKFCLYVCSLCLVLAAIGHHFSGVFISYLIVTSFLLWPALEYHNITGHLYQRIEPILQQLDHSIDSPHREKKLKAQKKLRTRSHPTADTDSSSDSDLDEFCPTPGPAVDAALAHAAAAGRPTRSSTGTSTEFTDTEPPSYMGGLSQVPSFDNTLDQSADELELELPYDDHPLILGKAEKGLVHATEAPGTSEAIRFNPSHFRNSLDTNDEEGALAEDLEFPDVEADGKSSGRSSQELRAKDDESPLLPPGAAMLLSQTVTSLMSDALTKLQDMGSQDDNSSISEPSQVSRHQQRLQTTDTVADKEATSSPKLLSMDSDSTDFEMLDREELEQAGGGRVTGDEKKDDIQPRRSGYGIGYLTSWLSGKK